MWNRYLLFVVVDEVEMRRNYAKPELALSPNFKFGFSLKEGSSRGTEIFVSKAIKVASSTGIMKDILRITD